MKKIISTMLVNVLLPSFYSICQSQIKPTLYKKDNFIVEEYPIKRENIIPEEILANRNPWRERLVITEEDMIGAINTKIKPLGYQVIKIWGMMAWDFCKGDEALAKELFDIRGFSMDKQQKNFVFLAKQRNKAGEMLVFIHNDIIKKIKKDDKFYDCYYFYKFYPFYIDNDLVWCEVSTKGFAEWDGIIRNQEKTLYTFSFLYGAGGMPVRFSKIDESWLLEIFEHEQGGRIILNGEDLRQKYNYSGMWEYHIVKDRPFFFFTHKGDKKYRISYDGKEVPDAWYDFVGYNGGWGVEGNGTMVWFYAMKGEQWFYVEAGAYE